MKPFLLTLLLCPTLFHAFSQDRDAGQRLLKKKCASLRILLSADQKDPSYPLLFDHINVLDYRMDTSRLGLVVKSGRKQMEIVLDRPVNAQLTSYMNERFTAGTAKHHLLVAVKNLWVSDPDTLNKAWPRWIVSFRLEAYLASGAGYIPLTYLDTSATYRGNSLTLTLEHRLPELIARFMGKTADHLLLDDLARRRVVSYGQIDSFAHSRYDYAMDTATTLVKGVYATVDEFRNNAPSILHFETLKGKDSLMELHIPDENGQMYYTHKVWGFCDGQHTYVMMDGNVFPVFLVGHQFYVLGSKEYQSHRMWVPFYAPLGGGSFAYGYETEAETVYRKLQLYRLDINTGEVGE